MTGRKRHLLVDTQGFVLKALVHPASMYDRDGGRLLLEALPELHEQFPRLRHLWVDVADQGRFVEWVQETFGWSVKVVKHWWTGVSKVWGLQGQEPPEDPGRLPTAHVAVDRGAHLCVAGPVATLARTTSSCPRPARR